MGGEGLFKKKNPEQTKIDTDLYHLKQLGKEKQLFLINGYPSGRENHLSQIYQDTPQMY